MRSKVAALCGSVVLVLGVGVVVAPEVSAGTIVTWTGAGTDANWSTPANWAGNVAPVGGDSIMFPAGAARTANNNDLPKDTSFNSISFTGSGYTTGGNALAGTHINQNSSGAITDTINLAFDFGSTIEQRGGDGSVLTLTGPFALGQSSALTIDNDQLVNITGAISGDSNSGVTLSSDRGGGRVVLSGTNTYGGYTQVTGDTDLVVNGAQPASQVFVNKGALEGTGTVGIVQVGSQFAPTPSVAPGDPVGTLHTGNAAISSNSVFVVRGTSASSGGFNQLAVTGTVALGAELDVELSFKPPVGTTFKLVDNDGSDPIQGAFIGAPEGSAFGSGGSFFKVTYNGGDGNDVVMTTVAGPPPSIVTAPGSGGGPNIRSFGGRSLNFFSGTGTGGAYVAARDFDFDGLDEIVVGSGAGVPSTVTRYRVDGEPLGTFSPYGSFAGGVSVAVGDLDGNGAQEIVTGAGPGGGPDVSIFRADGARLASFYVYDPHFAGGVNVATGDLNGDGADEIIVGAGSGGGPHVRIFNGDGTPQGVGFFAYDPRFAGGVSVATGDLDGNGTSEVITGAGAGGGPHVRTFSGSGTPLGGGFFAYSDRFFGGVTVSSYPDFGQGHDDIVTGVGPGGGPNVKGFLPDGSQLFSLFAYDPGFTGGVRVAGAVLNTPQ